MNIKSNIALITGSSGKLGYRIALALAEKGCDCICHYHKNETDVFGLVEKIESLGRKAYSVQADLRDADQIEKLFNLQVSPTILINSAAVFSRERIGEITADSARNTFEVNTVAPLLLIKSFVTNLKKSKGISGKVVNITDVGGSANWSQFSSYCASKAALISITKSLAKELAPKITVNAISPGYVDFSNLEEVANLADHISSIPMKRLAKAAEVISGILFVLENDYITGQIINIDGGRYI